MLEVARSPLEVAKILAREVCWSSEIVSVIDVATPYLPESWVSLDLAVETLRELSRCSCLWILVGVLVGDERKFVDALPSDLRKRVVGIDSLSVARVDVSIYRRVASVNVARVGTALIIARPRTAPYPPLLGSIALAATYLTLPEHRWALYADPRAVDSNIAGVFVTSSREAVSVVEASHVVACDGPLHGCIDSFLDALLVGSPVSTDWLLLRVASVRARYVDEVAKLRREPPRALGIGSFAEAPRLKMHSLSKTLAKGSSEKPLSLSRR